MQRMTREWYHTSEKKKKKSSPKPSHLMFSLVNSLARAHPIKSQTQPEHQKHLSPLFGHQVFVLQQSSRSSRNFSSKLTMTLLDSNKSNLCMSYKHIKLSPEVVLKCLHRSKVKNGDSKMGRICISSFSFHSLLPFLIFPKRRSYKETFSPPIHSRIKLESTSEIVLKPYLKP